MAHKAEDPPEDGVGAGHPACNNVDQALWPLREPGDARLAESYLKAETRTGPLQTCLEFSRCLDSTQVLCMYEHNSPPAEK